MAQLTQYQCDGCGETKGRTNHWFVLDNSWPTIITVRPFSEENATGAVLHLCGEACVMKAISGALGVTTFPVKLVESAGRV